MPQIEHIVVLMMENHSFDNLLGMVPTGCRDAPTSTGSRSSTASPSTSTWTPTATRCSRSRCLALPARRRTPSQNWNASHLSYDGGRNNGFVKASGAGGDALLGQARPARSPTRWRRHFPIGDRYFCSVLARRTPTAASCSTRHRVGHDRHRQRDVQHARPPTARSSIASTPTRSAGANYYQNYPSSSSIVPGYRHARPRQRACSSSTSSSPTPPPAGCRRSPSWTRTTTRPRRRTPRTSRSASGSSPRSCNALMHSPDWKHTALFLTYDEHGGYYDHVPPPRAIKPDSIAPMLEPRTTCPARYDRYGFRVPTDRGLALGASRTTSRTWSRTTPRSRRSSSASGTCRR